MKNEAKKIEICKVVNIVPNPKNANKHSEAQIERLSEIFEYSGFREPLVVSKQSGFLVSGHGRLEAAKKLGVKELPIIRQDFESPAVEYAHMIADNEIARWAELDVEKFKEEYGQYDVDIEMFGMKDFDLTEKEEVIRDGGEIDIDDLTKNLNTTCPKCGFEFENKDA